VIAYTEHSVTERERKMLISIIINHDIADVTDALKALLSHDNFVSTTLEYNLSVDDSNVYMSVDTIDDDLVCEDYDFFDCFDDAFSSSFFVRSKNASYMILDNHCKVICI